MKQPSSPIPQYVPKSSPIAKVASIAMGKPDELYFLSYRYYNQSECEIEHLGKNRGKETLQILKKIGLSSQDTIDEAGVDRLPVDPNGAYRALFNRLPEDFDVLFEHKIQGDGRIFYHTAGRTFYIIAIKNNHLETKKHRKK